MQYRQDIVTRMPIRWMELITNWIVTIRSICHNSAADFLRWENFCRNFGESCGATYRRNYGRLVHCKAHPVLLQSAKTASKSTHNWRRYPSSNWGEMTENAVLNLVLCCGAIWRRRENPQHRCTTTVHPLYNCSKKILENLLPVGLLVRTKSPAGSAYVHLSLFRAVLGLPIRNFTLAVSAT